MYLFMVLLLLYIAPLIIFPSVVFGLVIAWCTIFSFSSFTTSDHLSHPIPIPLAQKAALLVVFAIPLFAAFMFFTRLCSLSMLSTDAFAVGRLGGSQLSRQSTEGTAGGWVENYCGFGLAHAM